MAVPESRGYPLRKRADYIGADNTAPSSENAQSGFAWPRSDAPCPAPASMKGAVRPREGSAPAGGNTIDSQHPNANAHGVGGRQSSLRLPPQGGGYQDVCTDFGAAVPAPRAAAEDPRIRELRDVGLPSIWIRVARAIGFDAFVAMWQVLMQDGHVDDRCRVVVPNYARYLRYQRNRLIRQLIAEGHGVDEVRSLVKAATGENVSESHIRRAGQHS